MRLDEAEALGPKATAAKLRFEAALASLRAAAEDLADAGHEAVLVGQTSSGEKCIMGLGPKCRIEYRPSRRFHADNDRSQRHECGDREGGRGRRRRHR